MGVWVRRIIPIVCLVLALFSLGCEPDPPEEGLRLYFLKVDPASSTASLHLVFFHPGGAANDGITTAFFNDTENRYSYVFSEPEAGGLTYVAAGDVWFLTACSSARRRLTTSGAAALPTLDGIGCDKIAYLDAGNGFVTTIAGGTPTNVGPADAIHISPNGNRLLIAFNGTLQVCSVAGTGCTAVTPPEGGDLNTATFSPDSNHLLFRVLAEGRMQLSMVNLDGTAERRLTQLTDADVTLMAPFGELVALTLQYGPADYRIATLDPTTGELVVRVQGGWNTFAR